MPIYEYKCNNCHYEFEKLQSIKEDALLKCPKCHKKTLKKLVSGGSGLIFKGKGFYITDYKSNNQSKSKSSPESKKTNDTETKETKQSNTGTKE